LLGVPAFLALIGMSCLFREAFLLIFYLMS
jgi:hypothetical protein